MRIKIEAEAKVDPEQIIEALESNDSYSSREDIRANLEGAEFHVEIDGIKFTIYVDEASMMN